MQLSGAFHPREQGIRLPRALLEHRSQDILPLPFLLCKWNITGVAGKASGHGVGAAKGSFTQTPARAASVVTAEHHTSVSEVMHKTTSLLSQ